MANNLIQTSFMSGELSPNLYGMVDLQKYKAAMALMRNFFVDYRGGASSRFGTKYVNTARDSAHPVRLIPFAASFNVGYVLEFGEHYIRFHNNGATVLNPSSAITGVNVAGNTISSAGSYTVGHWIYVTGVNGVSGINGNYYVVTNSSSPYTVVDTSFNPPVWSGSYAGGGTTADVYEIGSPYAGADLAMVKFAQNVQFMVLCHPNYPMQLLTFGGPTNWTLAPQTFGTTIGSPFILTAISRPLPTTTFGYEYAITAVDHNGQESPIGLPVKMQGGDITNLSTGCSIALTWAPVAGAVSYNIYRIGPLVNTTNANIPDGLILGLVGSTNGTSYVDQNSAPDFQITPPVVQNPFVGASVNFVTTTGGNYGGAATLATVVFSPPGTPGGATAMGHLVINPTTGDVIGVSVDFGGAGYTSPPTVTYSGGTGAPPTSTVVTLNSPQGGPPSVPCYIQQRLALAAPLNFPQTVYFSQPGSPYNFNISNPTQADDAISEFLVSKQLNTIKSMVPMPAGLIVLTASSAFLIYGSQGAGSPITALSIVAQNQAYSGASDVPPITANDDILYVQSKTSIIRDLRFNFYTSVYTGIDISVLSAHLFFNFNIKEWCWAEEPFKLVWAVRSDGKLLSLTFSKEQEIVGWAHHDTQGLFQSTCSVTEVLQNTAVDAAYFVVQRTVRGQNLQYIERLADRFIPNGIVDAWCLDCALQYQGAPTTTFFGLGQLEGLSVVALADGQPVTGLVVHNGTVTLPTAASKVLVGLSYLPQLQSLPVEVGQPTVQGKRKRVGPAVLKVTDTRGLSIGRTFSTLVNIKDAAPPMLSQAGLIFGDEWVVLDSLYDPYGQICLQQNNPWPVTVLALIPQTEIGDTK